MAIGEMLDRVQRKLTLLPKDARGLGGIGECYREMTALVRQLERDALDGTG